MEAYIPAIKRYVYFASGFQIKTHACNNTFIAPIHAIQYRLLFIQEIKIYIQCIMPDK